MKKIFTLASMLLFAGWAANAQNAIPNPGFETWASGNPTGWSTLNGIVPGSCSQGTAVGEFHGGTNAIVLTTKSAGAFGIVPGTAATGTLNIVSQSFTGGVDFTLRPDSLVGWYKYAPLNSDGNATANVFLLKNNGADTVGVASFTAPTAQANWTRFAVAVAYNSSDAPEKAIFICTSGQATGGVVGTKANFDDLELIYNPPVGITNVASKGLISIYPNPVTDKVTFNLGSNKTAKVTIYNVIGSKVASTQLTETTNSMDLSLLPAGTYVWQLADANGNIIKTDKLILSK